MIRSRRDYYTNDLTDVIGRLDGQKCITLLEDEKQVADFLKRSNGLTDRVQFVALTPFAIHALDSHNLRYQIPEDYYDPQEIYQLGIGNYEKVSALCSIIDGKIQSLCPALEKVGITPALFNFYSLKIVYDAVTIRLFQLSKIFKAEKPIAAFTYATENCPFGISRNAPLLLFDNRESIYSHLLELENFNAMVNFLNMPKAEGAPPDDEPAEFADTIMKSIKKVIYSHPNLYSILYRTKKTGLRAFIMELKARLRGAPLLLVGSGYNWEDCQEELYLAGLGPTLRMIDDLSYWIPSTSKDMEKCLTAAWTDLLKDEEFCSLFFLDGIDFFPLLSSRIQFLVRQLSPVCLNAYEKAETLLKKRGVRAILASALLESVGQSFSKAAQRNRVPAIIWQLGSYGLSYDPMFLHTNLLNSDISFVFGMGVVKQFAKAADSVGAKLVPVGSASLDKLLQSISYKRATTQKKTILYITTNYYQNRYYVHLRPPFSDNHLWHVQRTILDALVRIASYDIMVKLHPSKMYREPPLRAYAREKKISNCRFIRNEFPLVDLIRVADVIVIDWPSTTLLQALATHKPIFIYTGQIKIDGEAEELLKRRAYCFSELRDLLSTLTLFLESGSVDIAVDLSDVTFLKAYGAHLHDGKSGIRATNMLIKTIKGLEGNANRK